MYFIRTTVPTTTHCGRLAIILRIAGIIFLSSASNWDSLT